MSIITYLSIVAENSQLYMYTGTFMLDLIVIQDFR